MNITLVIGSMRGGGAQRVLATLAHYFMQIGHNVSIVTVAPEYDYDKPELITWSPVFKKTEIKKTITNKFYRRLVYPGKLFNVIKKTKPDIVISFLVGINKEIIFITKLLQVPVIVSEHTNYKADMNFFSWIERRFIYKAADAVTVLTMFDYENYYSKFLKNVYVMPNPLGFIPVSDIKSRENIILAAGGLDRWYIKGFDNLLTVFSDLHGQYPEWKLQIAGGGEEGYRYLLELCKKLGIEHAVEFLGFQKEIETVMQKASIFVMSSRYEGFSMALLEAMSQGCACISFDCIAGPNEIITHNEDGLLVEDQNLEDMKKTLQRVMDDEVLRKKLSSNAIINCKKFSVQNIGNEWLRLIKSILDKGLA